jgi:branched-subunit amino acid ABC-type transport system permease component
VTGLLITQALNGLQLGVLLFLLAAGLTLVFGIMNFVNLAHGSLYMMGAYFAAVLVGWTGLLLLGALIAVPAAALLGFAVEQLALKSLYRRDHLDQVLATFGLILFFNELVRMIWGRHPSTCPRRPGFRHGEPARLLLSCLPLRNHRRRACSGSRPVLADQPHPHRDAHSVPAPPTRRWWLRSASTSRR